MKLYVVSTTTVIKAFTSILLSLALISCSQSPSRPTVPTSLPYSSPYGHLPSSGSNNPVRNRIVQSSYQALGVPYRYGGNTFSGFDCSGLTRHTYKSAGINIPRTAAQQRDASKTIRSYSDLLPGDMIFFKTGRTTNHVGIFVGNGEFIHASTGQRKVIKAKLDTPYWRRAFVKFGTYIR